MQRLKKHDTKQKELEPDNELLLWEKWIQIRNEEVKKLASKLHKPPVDLTMNLLEKVREKKEWKTALEHAKIDKKPLLRGQLWEQPLRLKQGCYCKPAYEVQRTLAEMGKPAVIEHITVPQYVKEVEKGLSGISERVNCTQLNADFCKYRAKRETDLQEKIAKIDPFRPNASDLIVIGSKPKTPPKKLPILPKITVTPMVRVTEENLCTVYAVRINNTVILKDVSGQSLNHLEKMKQERWHESCTTWSYYFHTPMKKAGRCKLFLQNLGTVTLRYCWKKIKRVIPFIPEDIYEQVFFFNKNEDVLSPGQSKEIFFTFLSNEPGLYCEYWELSFCNICFFDTMSEKLCVHLIADSIEYAKCIKYKFEILKARIDKKAINNIVCDIINDAILEATTVVPQKYPYKYLFLEAEMFKMKNPVCFYHQSEVMKMKELYSEMLPGKSWDLSIPSWREAMITKDYDDRMKYYDLLKKSQGELLKPWYEGENLLKEKYRAVKLLLGKMADDFDRKYDQLIDLYVPPSENQETTSTSSATRNSLEIDLVTRQLIKNLFYIHAYDYLATTVELCSGVLSSLELNKWIEFDFCKW